MYCKIGNRSLNSEPDGLHGYLMSVAGKVLVGYGAWFVS